MNGARDRSLDPCSWILNRVQDDVWERWACFTGSSRSCANESGDGRVFSAARQAPARQKRAGAARFFDVESDAQCAGCGERGGAGAGPRRRLRSAGSGGPAGRDRAGRAGAERGGFGAARVFQPCRNETTSQRPVKHDHRDIYLGVLAFLQRSLAKGRDADGASGPKAREVLRYE